jgi:type III secretory pathway component EscU
MTKKLNEGKIFNLKPEMTLAMKLAATFAITYYGLLLAFEIIAVVFRRYYFDTYYFNEGEMDLGSREFIVQIIQLALSVLLVFSLIQIFRKKSYGKAFFVSASIMLIIFQFIVTGLVPWMKYALEVFLLLVIAPLRVKKKVRFKEGKFTLEEVKEETTETTSEETTKKEPDA